jgi:hypothetical protein
MTVNADEVRENLRKVQEIYCENLPNIGTGALSLPWAANNRIGNVPRAGVFSGSFQGWSRPVFHEQLFIRKLDCRLLRNRFAPPHADLKLQCTSGFGGGRVTFMREAKIVMRRLFRLWLRV